jgi:hypothetical protein
MARYPELESLDPWIAATAARRDAIAIEIGKEHGLELETVAPFRRGDLPLASFRGMDGLFRFVLVPGGSFTAGLGAREVQTLEALAAAHRDDAEFDAAWSPLLSPTHPLRALRTVEVGPVLFAQNALADLDVGRWRTEMGDMLVGEKGDTSTLPEDIEEGLARFGYRFPTESEWEWCARGGREGELTYLGNDAPDARFLNRARRQVVESEGPDRGDRHAGIANDFGLLGFGIAAEICANAFADPFGPASKVPLAERVVRGGAGATYPWQSPAERQALLTAHRQRCGGLSVAAGIRPVRTIARD